MLERTQRRQELLASVALETPIPTDTKALRSVELVKTTEPSLSPPSRCQRRTRLAELASRVDQWLEEDHNLKPNENVSSEIEVLTFFC